MPSPRYNHSAAELEQIQRDFLPVRKRHWTIQWTGVGLVLLGAVMGVTSADWGQWFMVPGALLVIYARITWRCPVCGGWFAKNWVRGKCWRCGTMLTE